MKREQSHKEFLKIAGIVLIIGFLGYGGYHYWELYEREKVFEAKSIALEESLRLTEEALSNTKKENMDLNDLLSKEQNKNESLGTQLNGLTGAVGQISGTVDTLQKLRAIDPELLKKYSKVYFLSENYVPSSLSEIDPRYVYDTSKSEQVQSRALPFLQRMLNAAKDNGVTLQIVSAYRSFDEQATVKSGYKVIYGSGANQFSADQGYSEHQLGTAADFTSPEIKVVFTKFEGTTAYIWLSQNAYKFGFILSYPKNNSYYQFEPWHWRFVGVALATTLHGENKYFYELDQREIDQYLITLFD